ncbi:MAG: hypothetical protein GOV15_01120, partial [Candidatus Diapherotrites archaeon]|nr:hypothetical protein [Candidatus Diapherotrites archaeon]
TEFSGPTPPSVFVGDKFYPNVFVAPLASPLEQTDPMLLDSSYRWYGKSLEEIVEMRSVLIRSNQRSVVTSAANPDNFLFDLQDLALSRDSVSVDVSLKKPPTLGLSFHKRAAPMGPSASLKAFELTENPRMSRAIDKAYGDTEWKAKDAVLYLYDKGTSVDKITNVLSVGALGIGSQRKLVPTKWSITAVDDMVSKTFVEEIKQLNLLSDFLVFHSKYLDNDFYVVLFPMPWAFEQIEAWGGSPIAGGWSYSVDSELGRGRKAYASSVAGAYYAARLAVSEFLLHEKKQAGALILREIGKDYNVPVGVWQIRENVRHALKEKPLVFSSYDLVLKFLDSKLKIKSRDWLKKSELVKHYKTQTRLTQFF